MADSSILLADLKSGHCCNTEVRMLRLLRDEKATASTPSNRCFRKAHCTLLVGLTFRVAMLTSSCRTPISPYVSVIKLSC
ncbi:hypothetical protein F2Q68_00026792 [Brassica cretica]|uniref:Uncharacterized protein n=1 Tax=Brassica cretica TaxID=69181 RepID=A0A8S9I9E3_BRACR|nr:hypothetical protein F2Q68_00026792 [Brassica cretica]